jgi:transposase-like protein
MVQGLMCPECQSKKLIKLGIIWSGRKRSQKYQCQDCGRQTVRPLKVAPGTKVLVTEK